MSSSITPPRSLRPSFAPRTLRPSAPPPPKRRSPFSASLAAKTAWMAFALSSFNVVVAAVFLFFAEHPRGAEPTPHEVLRAFTPFTVAAGIVPVLLGTLGAYIYGRQVTRSRVVPIADAMSRIAAGDFEPPFEAPSEPEFESVGDSFHAMRSVLIDALARLAHQDSQRRRFFADLAHDLASPVSTVLSIVDTLEAEGLVRDPEQRVRLLGMLEREAERLAHLVRDIRELAYLDDPDVRIERENADVGEVVRSVAESISVGGRGARVEVAIAPVRAPIDPMRIEQVIHNLLQNARRHTPSERAIRVEVSAVEHFARIVVEDDGPGVSDETLSKLGERFFRADSARERSSGGHGLGLSIVAAIVERHEGRLEFERAASGGLRVTIDLPAFGGEDPA